MKFTVTYDYVGNNVVLHRIKADTNPPDTNPLVPTVHLNQTPDHLDQPTDTVTFTAVITPESQATFGIPGGTVEFFDGGTSLGTAPVQNNGGAATATLTKTLAQLNALHPGEPHSVTATYSGDDNFNGSSTPSQDAVVFGDLHVTSATPADPTFRETGLKTFT